MWTRQCGSHSRILVVLVLLLPRCGFVVSDWPELVCGKILESPPYREDVIQYCKGLLPLNKHGIYEKGGVDDEPLLASESADAAKLTSTIRENFQQRMQQMEETRAQAPNAGGTSKESLRGCASVAYLHMSRTGGQSVVKLVREGSAQGDVKFHMAAQDEDPGRNASSFLYFQPEAPHPYAEGGHRVNFYELPAAVFHVMPPQRLAQKLREMRAAEEERGCMLWVLLSWRKPEQHFLSQWRWNLRWKR